MSLNTEPANVDDAYTSLSNLLALVQTTVKNFQPTSGTGYASQETLSSGFGGVPAFLNADASSSTLSNLLSSLSSDYTDTPHSSMCDANTRTYTHVDADDNIGNVTHDRFNDDCNSATNGDGYDENYEHEKNYRDPHRSAVLALSCEAAYGRCASEFTELQAGSLQAEKEHEALDEYLDNQKKEEAKRLRDGRVQARRRKVEDEEREKKKEEEHTKQLEKDAARILAHHSNSNSSDLTLKVKENIQKIKKSEGRKRRVRIEGDNDDDRKYDEDSDGVRNSRGTHEKNSDDDVPCDSWTRTTPQLKRERQFRASSCSTLALPSSFLVPHPLSPSSRKKNKQATREKMQEYEKVHQVRLEIERRRKLHLQRLEQQQMPRVRNKNNTSAVQESSTSALRKMNTSDKSASRSLRVHARSGVKTASSMNRALKNKLCPEAKYALALTCRGRSSNRVGGKQTRKRTRTIAGVTAPKRPRLVTSSQSTSFMTLPQERVSTEFSSSSAACSSNTKTHLPAHRPGSSNKAVRKRSSHLKKATVRSRLAKSMHMMNPGLPSAAASVRQRLTAKPSVSSSVKPLCLSVSPSSTPVMQNNPSHPAVHRPELSARIRSAEGVHNPAQNFASVQRNIKSRKPGASLDLRPSLKSSPRTEGSPGGKKGDEIKTGSITYHPLYCPKILQLPFPTLSLQSIDKFPRKLRQSSVNRLYRAYRKKKPGLFQTSTRGCDTVVALEKKIYSRANSKSVYSNLCVHALQEIMCLS